MAHPAVVVSAPSDASLTQHYPAHLSAPTSISQGHFHAPPRFTLDGHGSSASSDSEDDDEQEAGEEAYTPPSSNHEHSLNPTSRAHKDAARREHVLRELVESELAYVNDLRMLVEVYLPRLPSILVPDARIIARNSQQLLDLHIELADAFEAAGSVVEFSVSSVDATVAAVADIFVSFQDRLCTLYDTFCEGHRSASDAVKRADARPDFAAFEKVCAAHGLDNTEKPQTDAAAVEPSNQPAATSSSDLQPASGSVMMTPTDEPAPALQHSHSDPVPTPIEVRQPSSTRLSILLPRRHSVGAADANTTPKLASKPFTKGHASSGSTSSTGGDRRPALRFSDYLIKPVQRICRYQLLLAQLVPVGTAADTSARASLALQSALRTARHAAEIANEAPRRAEALARTTLINARIAASSTGPLSFGGRVQGQGHGAGALPREFLDSLGPVRFAGSLDVVYVPPQPTQTQDDEPFELVSRTPSSKSLSGGSSNLNTSGTSAASLGRLASAKRKRLGTLGMTALTSSSAADGGEASTSRAAAASASTGSNRSAARSSHRKRDGKRRHLGVFVYDGGYVVMVKVLKHKVYEPRHWFALTPACVVAEIVPDETTDDFAFEITTACGHTLTCFASGDREQSLWLDNLAEARAATPRWAPEDARCSLAGGASGLPGSTVASPESYTIPLPPDFPGLEALEMESAVAHGLGQGFVLEREATLNELPTPTTTPHGTVARRTTTKRNSLPASGGSVTRAERGLDDVLSSTYAQARNHAKINGGHAREGTGSTLKDKDDSLTRSPSSSSVAPSPVSVSRRPPFSRPSSSSGDATRNTASGVDISRTATTATIPSLAGSRELSVADLAAVSLNSPGRPQHSPSRPPLRHEPVSMTPSHASSTMSTDTGYSRTTTSSCTIALTTSVSVSSFARRSKSRSNSDPRRPASDEPAPQLPPLPVMGPVGPLHRVGGVLGPQLDTLFAAAPTPPAEEPLLEEREDGYTWGSPPRSPKLPGASRRLSESPRALSRLSTSSGYVPPEEWELVSPVRDTFAPKQSDKKMRRKSLRMLFSPRLASSRPSTAEKKTPTVERMGELVQTPNGIDHEHSWLNPHEDLEIREPRRSNVTEARSIVSSSSNRSSAFYPPGSNRSARRRSRLDVEPDTRPVSMPESPSGWWASLSRRVRRIPDTFQSSISTPHINLTSAPAELHLSPTGLTSSPALGSKSPGQDHIELPSDSPTTTPSPKRNLWKRKSLRLSPGADLLRSSSVSMSSFRRLAGGAHDRSRNRDDANRGVRPEMPSPSPSFTPSSESGTTGSDPAVATPGTDEGFLSAFRANSVQRARSDDGHESYAFTDRKERRLSRGLSMLSSLKRVTPLEAAT